VYEAGLQTSQEEAPCINGDHSSKVDLGFKKQLVFEQMFPSH
jgi:hypothetical protein